LASRLAIDIGGTFTDLVLLDEDNGDVRISKVQTTPDDPAKGVIASINKARVDLTSCRYLIHGTTVVINTVLERKGARTALITTKGFRDVYSIGRFNRTEMYDPFYRKPEPFVPRHLTYEVAERLNYRGEVLRPLDRFEIESMAGKLRENGVLSVAVCLLHSYANPSHEVEIEKIMEEENPEILVSLSSEVAREFREYERTSTVVINAYVKPMVDGYIRSLEGALQAMGFDGAFLIMQSNGGIMSSRRAREIPVQVIESGPSGGVIGCAYVSRVLGFKNVISFDMGGTTAKSSIVIDGEPRFTADYKIGGYAHGHPVKVPVVDVSEVGTGGGSIAWVGPGNSLKVGPKSAGAFPGPICYGYGGTQPTVTDANVLLGRINPNRFLGGEMRLDLDASRKGIKELAEHLELDGETTLRGIIRVADSNMSLSIRAVTLERGFDPRDFTMIAFGGGGPLHATDLARDLRIPEVVVPPDPAHFSAWGMLNADIRHDYVRTYITRIETADMKSIIRIYAELEEEGRRTLVGEGISESKIGFSLSADMRYFGQEHAVSVPISMKQLESEDRRDIRESFDRLHNERYGHSAPAEAAEIVNLRVAAVGLVEKPRFEKVASSGAREGSATGTRKVFHTSEGVFLETPTYLRDELKVGSSIIGPAIIEEYASTILLAPGDVCEVNSYGYIVIRVKKK